MNNTTAEAAVTAAAEAETLPTLASNVFQRHITFNSLLRTFVPVGLLAERVVPPVWYVIGFLGNPLSAVVWFGRRMRRNNSSAVYLGSLALSDSAFLFLHLLYTLHVAWGYDVYNFEGGCEMFMVLFYLPQYLSVVLVAAFSTERYVAVCHPFLKEKWCTVRRACFLTLFCTVSCTALASAQAYFWAYHPSPLDTCNTRPAAAVGSPASFWEVWSWVVDMVLFAALPLLVLLVNALVLREIVRLSRHCVVRRHCSLGEEGTVGVGGRGGDGSGSGRGGGAAGGGGSSNAASTLTLLSVSFFLIATQLTATLVSNLQPAFPTGPAMLTDDEVRGHPVWARLFAYLSARKVIETLCLSHFACYFFVYCVTGHHFRLEVLRLLTCRRRLQYMQGSSQRRDRYSMVSSNCHTLGTDGFSTVTTM